MPIPLVELVWMPNHRLFSVGLLCLAIFINYPTSASAPVANPELARAILEKANEARAANGQLPPLKMELALMNAALSHSLEMAELNYFEHTSPTPGRTKPHDRIRLSKGFDTHIGENIYKISNPADNSVEAVASRCVQAWLNSPPHRHNLLSPEYNRMGLGVATTGDTYLITQNFGYEAIEIETLDSTRNDKGGFEVSLTFTVVDGTHNGDIFYEGASVAKWSAKDGLATVELTVRGPGILQIGQVKTDGTPKESVSCEFAVWTEPTHFALSEMPLLSH